VDSSYFEENILSNEEEVKDDLDCKFLPRQNINDFL